MPNTVISHDSKVADYTLVGANVTISGQVTIAKNCYLGSNTSIKDHTKIGKGSLIGIGSNVITNIPKNCVAAGNPARVIRKTS